MTLVAGAFCHLQVGLSTSKQPIRPYIVSKIQDPINGGFNARVHM